MQMPGSAVLTTMKGGRRGGWGDEEGDEETEGVVVARALAREPV